MGLSLSAYYEFSKQMDDYSGPYGIQDFFNRQNDWSLTSYNQPQRLQLSYSYELPLGANKPFLTYSDWRRYVIGRLVGQRHGYRSPPARPSRCGPSSTTPAASSPRLT